MSHKHMHPRFYILYPLNKLTSSQSDNFDATPTQLLYKFKAFEWQQIGINYYYVWYLNQIYTSKNAEH